MALKSLCCYDDNQKLRGLPWQLKSTQITQRKIHTRSRTEHQTEGKLNLFYQYNVSHSFISNVSVLFLLNETHGGFPASDEYLREFKITSNLCCCVQWDQELTFSCWTHDPSIDWQLQQFWWSTEEFFKQKAPKMWIFTGFLHLFW